MGQALLCILEMVESPVVGMSTDGGEIQVIMGT